MIERLKINDTILGRGVVEVQEIFFETLNQKK